MYKLYIIYENILIMNHNLTMLLNELYIYIHRDK